MSLYSAINCDGWEASVTYYALQSYTNSLLIISKHFTNKHYRLAQGTVGDQMFGQGKQYKENQTTNLYFCIQAVTCFNQVTNGNNAR